MPSVTGTTMLPVFFLTLREGLEAALIIGIVLAYLNRTERMNYAGSVWAGLTSALVLCAVLGWVIFQFLGGYDASIPAEKNALRLFEGSACLIAAVVLTAVIVWMHRNARNLGPSLRTAVDEAVNTKQSWALFGLIFVTVGREGLETLLILPGMSKGTPGTEVTGGIVLGLGVAVAVGIALHKGAKVMDLQRFFKVTGILLIFFAAGLVAYGVHELQDAGKLPIITEHVWDMNHVLHDKNSAFGVLLKGLFGYNGNPSLIEVVSYFGYLLVSLVLFLKPATVPPEPAAV
jgi:high-affinity iron transporter